MLKTAETLRAEYQYMARYTPNDWGMALPINSIFPESLFQGDFQALQNAGVPEISAKEFDSKFFADVENMKTHKKTAQMRLI